MMDMAGPYSVSEWIPATNGFIPNHALSIGLDSGQNVYIARAYYNGDLLPGKIIQGHGGCYVPWGGIEHFNNKYEVFCPLGNIKWTSYKNLPGNGKVGGFTNNNQPLYIARAIHKGSSVVVGKIHNGTCYYSYDGNEHIAKDYEILLST